MFRPLPPQSVLHEWLDYNPSTGVFVWKKDRPRGGPPLAGKIAGTKRKTSYIFISVAGRRPIGAHRIAWVYVYGSLPDGTEIDHIDGNPSNNAIDNLRLATSSQQKQNKRVQTNNRCGLKGAFYHAAHKGKKWRSQIKVGDELIFLGYFHTPQEAHAAYAVAAVEHFGEFARAA